MTDLIRHTFYDTAEANDLEDRGSLIFFADEKRIGDRRKTNMTHAGRISHETPTFSIDSLAIIYRPPFFPTNFGRVTFAVNGCLMLETIAALCLSDPEALAGGYAINPSLIITSDDFFELAITWEPEHRQEAIRAAPYMIALSGVLRRGM